MYKTKHFTIQELVHPQILADIGEEKAWMRLDEGCLRDLDLIREKWGNPIYINQGDNDSRGLRPPNDPDGAFYSVHKQGKAFDLVPANGDYMMFWGYIYDLMRRGYLTSFNTIEDSPLTQTWTHIAKMNHEHNALIIGK